ncbi:hypothetical protein HZB02_06620 [Candidatus Woesearchaeota archaeon]|nr:hypothetical protein [Candidatus Woesearchaeota archaeon]
MDIDAICADPAVERYQLTLVHPEITPKSFAGIITLTPEELHYFQTRGFDVLYSPSSLPDSLKNVEVQSKQLTYPHVSLGFYSENLVDGELQVYRSPYNKSTYLSHWHPSCNGISQERLVQHILLGILSNARSFNKEPSLPFAVAVKDPLWNPVVDSLKEVYPSSSYTD